MYLGIGCFVIYDEVRVEEVDLGVNFFLDEDSLGKLRLESFIGYLLELNLEVQGDWYLNEVGGFICDFQLVIML